MRKWKDQTRIIAYAVKFLHLRVCVHACTNEISMGFFIAIKEISNTGDFNRCHSEQCSRKIFSHVDPYNACQVKVLVL